jgi:copper(I)-binding protein
VVLRCSEIFTIKALPARRVGQARGACLVQQDFGIFIMRFSLTHFFAASLICAATGVSAQNAPLQVSGAWARATVPGQVGTGAFMTLQSQQDLQLVGASSAAAGVAQIHEMKLEGDTMRMRPMKALALPAHQSVALTPGGNHIMLMDLKQALAAGSTIQVELKLQDATGKTLTQTVDVPVRQNASAGAGHGAAMHGGAHGS